MISLNAKFIWCDMEGRGRNLFAFFRRTFSIHSIVKSAQIHIFADTCYQLFINGIFIDFGPIRFDPRFPRYDTYDIADFLKPGKNVIAIKVNHYGCKT